MNRRSYEPPQPTPERLQGSGIVEVIQNEDCPAGRKWEYREVTINVGKNWRINPLFGPGKRSKGPEIEELTVVESNSSIDEGECHIKIRLRRLKRKR